MTGPGAAEKAEGGAEVHDMQAGYQSGQEHGAVEQDQAGRRKAPSPAAGYEQVKAGEGGGGVEAEAALTDGQEASVDFKAAALPAKVPKNMVEEFHFLIYQAHGCYGFSRIK